MANAVKGEVGFRVGGATFTLCYDFNALCTIETELGIELDDLGEQMKSVNSMRTIFRVGLAEHHGHMTDVEAGRLIQELGIKPAFQLVERAIKAAFPDANEGDGGAEGNAKKAGTSRGR